MSKREELIASLNESFKVQKENNDNQRYRIETMTVEEHTFQRMLDIKAADKNNAEFPVEKQYINGFIKNIKEEKDDSVKKAVSTLEDVFGKSCDENDKDKILQIYELAKEYSLKLNMIGKHDGTRAILLMKLCGEISKL